MLTINSTDKGTSIENSTPPFNQAPVPQPVVPAEPNPGLFPTSNLFPPDPGYATPAEPKKSRRLLWALLIVGVVAGILAVVAAVVYIFVFRSSEDIQESTSVPAAVQAPEANQVTSDYKEYAGDGYVISPKTEATIDTGVGEFSQTVFTQENDLIVFSTWSEQGNPGANAASLESTAKDLAAFYSTKDFVQVANKPYNVPGAVAAYMIEMSDESKGTYMYIVSALNPNTGKTTNLVLTLLDPTDELVQSEADRLIKSFEIR